MLLLDNRKSSMGICASREFMGIKENVDQATVNGFGKSGASLTSPSFLNVNSLSFLKVISRFFHGTSYLKMQKDLMSAVEAGGGQN